MKKLWQLLGVDKTIAYSIARQFVRIGGGFLTLALISHYFTPEIQGYYYTFASLLTLQVFLEMGLSQNILQFASHEFAKLRLDERKRIVGDARARSRLLSLGRFAIICYGAIALLFFGLVGGVGDLFFATHPTPDGPSWRLQWWLLCGSTAVTLALSPFWSLLSGCGMIAEVSLRQFQQALASLIVSAISIPLGSALFTPFLISFSGNLIGLVFLFSRWRHFFGEFREAPVADRISWRREIWPFQWRIAISWMSGYFIFNLFNPVIFSLLGPVATGRFGQTMTVVRMIGSISVNWTSSKIPRFGKLIAEGRYSDLDRLWKSAATRGIAIASLGAGALLVTLFTLQHYLPSYGARFVSLPIAAVLVFSIPATAVVNVMAHYLRSHKKEPYLFLSIAQGLLTALLLFSLTKWFGLFGSAFSYTGACLVVAPWAAIIFFQKRREWHFTSTPQ